MRFSFAVAYTGGMGDLADYMTTREVADFLAVTKPRVDQLCEAGKLKYEMKGNVRLFLRADVEAFAKLDRPVGRPKKPPSEKPDTSKKRKK